MSKPSARSYISSNNITGAYERFLSAYSNWKDHWWETVETIYKNSAEWAKKYILDPIKRTLTAIGERVRIRNIKAHSGASYVYLIKMFDDNNQYVFLKGGKADDIRKRLSNLSRQEYKRDDVQISRVEIINTWELPNSHLAECFEQALHDYLCRFFEHIPNDRYYPHELTTEQFAELDRRHEIVCSFA